MTLSDRDYVVLAVTALRREVEARLKGNDRAVSLSQTTLTDRLTHSNGLIEQMRQQSAEFARHSELYALSKRVESLEQARSRLEGKSHGTQPLVSIGMVLIAAVIGAIVSFVAVQITR